MIRLLHLIIFIAICSLIYPQTSCEEKEKRIDSIMNQCIVTNGKHPVYSFLLFSKNYSSGCEIKTGVGTVGKNKGPIDADFQFNTASITKTMVAAIILQLEEEGRMSIKDPAIKYIGDLGFLNFRNFHFFRGKPYADSITIEMLLNHTSGIADIFTDAATRFNISVLLHKKRQYTPEKVIIKYFRYNLNKKAFNKPGNGYHYSDINYMVLGFIIEKILKIPLHQAIRERIISPLKMNNSYFDFYEEPHGNLKRIDAYLNNINMTQKINTSYEWAGGGIVSTTEDLGIFITSLLNGKLFINNTTLLKMMDTSKSAKFGADYGLGLIKYSVGKNIFFGHGGFYGSLMIFDPLDQFLFCGNIGQAIPPYDSGEIAKKIIRIIAEK
jgi:D-alanyl-D-alanine carboxypeptidase